MDNERIEEVLEFSIKVRTNTGKEKLICFSDIRHHIGSSLANYHDDYDNLTKIEFKLDCLGYKMEIIDI